MVEINREEYGREVEKNLFKIGLIKDEQKFFKKDTDVIQEEEKYLKGSLEEQFKQIREIGSHWKNTYGTNNIRRILARVEITWPGRVYALLTGLCGSCLFKGNFDAPLLYKKQIYDAKKFINEIYELLKLPDFMKLVLLKNYIPCSSGYKQIYDIIGKRAIENEKNVEKILGRPEIKIPLNENEDLLKIIKEYRIKEKYCASLSIFFSNGSIGLYPVRFVRAKKRIKLSEDTYIYFPVGYYDPLEV